MRPSDTLPALICTILMLTSALVLGADFSKSEKGAQLTIISPLNGAKLQGPIRIEIDSKMIMMMPEGVPHSGSGHIHLVVNPSGNPKAGDSLLSSSKHFSFDQVIDIKTGKRDTSVLLPAGTYRIQAILGDHKHRAHMPPVLSEVVEFTVEAKGASTKAKTLEKEDESKKGVAPIK